MGLQVPFPPYLLAFFFLFVVTVTIYFRETQTSKVDKTKQNKQFLHGAATTASQCGIPDHLIKTIGRWTSDAYQL